MRCASKSGCPARVSGQRLRRSCISTPSLRARKRMSRSKAMSVGWGTPIGSSSARESKADPGMKPEASKEALAPSHQAKLPCSSQTIDGCSAIWRLKVSSSAKSGAACSPASLKQRCRGCQTRLAGAPSTSLPKPKSASLAICQKGVPLTSISSALVRPGRVRHRFPQYPQGPFRAAGRALRCPR